jgi:ribosome-binding protein aMBF1 (putative translation factor)
MHARPTGAEESPRTGDCAAGLEDSAEDTAEDGTDRADGELTMNVALVRQLITERDWTWADLAREMGMSKSTISRVVRYETLPGRRFIFALNRIFPGQPELFSAMPEQEEEAA